MAGVSVSVAAMLSRGEDLGSGSMRTVDLADRGVRTPLGWRLAVPEVPSGHFFR